MLIGNCRKRKIQQFYRIKHFIYKSCVVDLKILTFGYHMKTNNCKNTQNYLILYSCPPACKFLFIILFNNATCLYKNTTFNCFVENIFSREKLADFSVDKQIYGNFAVSTFCLHSFSFIKISVTCLEEMKYMNYFFYIACFCKSFI